MATPHRVYGMAFAKVYPLYLQKVAKKGRSQAELDEVIAWLTGHAGEGLSRVLEEGWSMERFFAEAPAFNPLAERITGLVCGVRVEAVEEPLMKQIRQLDKLVDELAKGKKMGSILRS